MRPQAWRPDVGSWTRDLVIVLTWLCTFAVFVGAWILLLSAASN